MSTDTALYILALVCLVADAFLVEARLKWFSIAAALLVLSLIV